MKKAVLREYLKKIELKKDILSLNKDKYFTFEVDEPKKIKETKKVSKKKSDK